MHAFGDGAYGQLGQGDTASHLSPAEVRLPAAAKSPVSFVAAGTNHSAVVAGGELWLMGDGTPLGLRAGVHAAPTLCLIKDAAVVQVPIPTLCTHIHKHTYTYTQTYIHTHTRTYGTKHPRTCDAVLTRPHRWRAGRTTRCA